MPRLGGWRVVVEPAVERSLRTGRSHRGPSRWRPPCRPRRPSPRAASERRGAGASPGPPTRADQHAGQGPATACRAGRCCRPPDPGRRRRSVDEQVARGEDLPGPRVRGANTRTATQKPATPNMSATASGTDRPHRRPALQRPVPASPRPAGSRPARTWPRPRRQHEQRGTPRPTGWRARRAPRARQRAPGCGR